MQKKVGIDLGFNTVKATDLTVEHLLPSVIGTAFQSMVDLGGNGITFESPLPFVAGENALRYAENPIHAKDKDWIHGDDFYHLFLAALSELTQESGEVLAIVGLPVSLYRTGRELVERRLQGVHRFKRERRPEQTVTVTCKTFPQGVGTICDEFLDDAGQICSELVEKAVGVIDLGSRISNLLWMEKFRDVTHRTVSIDLGCWNVVDELIKRLQPRLARTLTEYQGSEALRTGKVDHQGQVLDCQAERADAIQVVSKPLLQAISNVWPQEAVAALQRIFIAGGGTYSFGKMLMDKYPQACQAKSPLFSNARGSAKYARGFLA